MFNFPRVSLRELLHYMEVHLEGNKVDTVVIHIGVNELLNDNSLSKIYTLMSNIKSMSLFH